MRSAAKSTILVTAYALCLIPALTSSVLLAQPVAQNVSVFPDRPVRVIVPVTAGGGSDIVARIVLSKMSESLNRQFVVDNRPGAGGLLGTDIVAKARADGNTLLFTYAGHTIVPFIYSQVPYDAYNDFAPISLASSKPLLLTLHPSVKANSVQELIALAHAKPGELNVALATTSSSGALAAELFKILTHSKIVSVPFKGGGLALTALMSGEVHLLFSTPTAVIPYLKSGKLKVIATSGSERASYLPNVPTLVEAGIKDLNTAPWEGLLAPAKTPGGIVDAYYRAVVDALKTPYVRERFSALGGDAIGSSPREFSVHLRRELDQNRLVIKTAGIKAD